MQNFLIENSISYKGIISSDILGKGGEAIVYRIEHVGVDEVVAKVPLIKKGIHYNEMMRNYESIFYET